MTLPEAKELIPRLISGHYDASEKEAFEAWLRIAPSEEVSQIIDLHYEELGKLGFESVMPRSFPEELAKKLEEAEQTGSRYTWWRYAAAVILLLLVARTFYVFNHAHHEARLEAKDRPSHSHDIAPGGNKAVLTLVDGSRIILDSVHAGAIAKEGNAMIVKKADGLLAANAIKGGVAADPLQINVLETPQGGQYQIQLADGTQVWLNALSSIRFPTAFTGSQRRVEITGEVYFEVAANPSKPFFVSLPGGAQVQVLGTSFNVNAYADESDITTTLLGGSVKVVSRGRPAQLKPGEQALISNADAVSPIQVKETTDDEQAIAWKNGLFYFQNTDLAVIMRQLQRWYGVEFVYPGKPRELTLSGVISRHINLSKVLEMLELSGVHCTIEGSRIIVKP